MNRICCGGSFGPSTIAPATTNRERSAPVDQGINPFNRQPSPSRRATSAGDPPCRLVVNCAMPIVAKSSLRAIIGKSFSRSSGFSHASIMPTAEFALRENQAPSPATPPPPLHIAGAIPSAESHSRQMLSEPTIASPRPGQDAPNPPPANRRSDRTDQPGRGWLQNRSFPWRI